MESLNMSGGGTLNLHKGSSNMNKKFKILGVVMMILMASMAFFLVSERYI
jgi:hypothetical protein